jgi:hypothetical protein
MPGTDTVHTSLYQWLRLLVSGSQAGTTGRVEGRMDILIILGVVMVMVFVMAYGEGR